MAGLLVQFAVLLAAVLSCCQSREALLHLVDNPGEGVCLDGSPPGFYYRAGKGSSASKVIIHLEGGGACETNDECLQRSKTDLGSSKNWPKSKEFGGFLSDWSIYNPDFHEWAVVFVNYCDGGCYSGYVANPVNVNGTQLYYRGYKILGVVMQTLLKNGLSEATEVILTGCSAGGLGTYIHVDYVKSLLPSTIKYRALADAGYFIETLNVNGEPVAHERAQALFNLQNMTLGLNKECTKVYNGSDLYKCLGPENLYPFIQTPIFAFNSQYDTWQIENNLELNCNPSKSGSCTSEQLKKLDEFHQTFMKAAAPIVNSTSNGAFLDSCLAHCQSLGTSWTKVKIGGQSAAETFANWYFERSTGSKKEIDCPSYTCNSSC